MISDVRKYFNALLNASSFKEHKDAFNIDNVPETIFDRAFHLSYSIPSSGESDDFKFEDNYSIELKLFFKGYRDIQTALDNAYDQSHTLRLAFVNRHNIDDFNITNDLNNPILNIYSNSIIADRFDTNDNAIIVTINLTLRRLFTNC